MPHDPRPDEFYTALFRKLLAEAKKDLAGEAWEKFLRTAVEDAGDLLHEIED